MPIYEYQCSQCGHQLEEFQKISEAPLTECPKCHKPSLNRLISASGFQLKGTGWYVTDYSKKGQAKTKSSDSETTATEKKADANSDTKPTETKPSDSSSSTDSGAATT